MRHKTLREMEEAIKKAIDLGESTPYLGTLTDQVRDKFISNMIRKYNKHGLKNHTFSSEGSRHDEGISLAKLKGLHDDKFNFRDVERIIKAEFERTTEKDRIAELMPQIDIKRAFKLGNTGWWDDLNPEMLPMLEGIKKFPLSFYTDEYLYKARERVNKLLEFLRLSYKIEIENVNDIHNVSIKDWEDGVNRAQKEITIKLHKEVMYITFADERNANKFRNSLRNELNEYFKRRAR